MFHSQGGQPSNTKVSPHCFQLSDQTDRMVETTATERRILVAVDSSEESMSALSWCLDNVISTNSKEKDTLVLLYVKPPRTVYAALDGTGYLFSSDFPTAMDKYRNDVAYRVMQKAMMRVEKDLQNIKLETRIEHGDPRDVICQMTQKLGADVLVMGSHGYGPIKRALHGSVSNHCAQKVKCPILIVKKPTSAAGNN